MDETTVNNNHILVKDLKPGFEVLQFFVVSSKETRKTKNGQDYLNLSLSDMSGSIIGKIWENAMKINRLDFETGDFVKVKGNTQLFGENLQLNVERIRKSEISEIPNLNYLIKKTAFDVEFVCDQIMEDVEHLLPQELSQLVKTLLLRELNKFKMFPAARKIHHAYIGGLIEHTFTVLTKVKAMTELIPGINENLAIAGAILHDIGKLYEIDPQTKSRTLEGRLKGHVMLGLELLRDTAKELDLLEASWLSELEHIMLSHHGELQFGALVKSFTREAILVHFMDNLDSKLKIIDEALEKTDSKGFSDYNKYLEGRAYAGSHGMTEE